MNAETTTSFQDASSQRDYQRNQADQRASAMDIMQAYHNVQASMLMSARAIVQMQETMLHACITQAKVVGEQLEQVENQQRTQMRQRA